MIGIFDPKISGVAWFGDHMVSIGWFYSNLIGGTSIAAPAPTNNFFAFI